MPKSYSSHMRFRLHGDFTPRGDQPQAISELVAGVHSGSRHQVLLGVTGSGKTYTMACVIEQVQKPVLIMAPNKTLAAQLYGEFMQFFPESCSPPGWPTAGTDRAPPVGCRHGRDPLPGTLP